MATTTTKQVSYSDDLSNVEAVAIVQVDGKDSEPGASLSNGQAVSIQLTDGQAVWKLDTARNNPLVATLKKQGAKQKKRGRKVSA